MRRRQNKKADGGSRACEYRAWINMISRCENKNERAFHRYGGRGIRVCAEWRESYNQFLSDMGKRPSQNHSLDRIDLNGDYSAANCRWATSKEQARNTSQNRLVEWKGKIVPLIDAVTDASVCYNTVTYRLKRGWSLIDALTRPQQRGVKP